MADSYKSMNDNAKRGEIDFSIGLCTFRNLPDLCACLLCCPCRNASARTQLDGSSFCLNFLCCLTPAANRYIVRSAYGIKPTCCSLGWCGLPCCFGEGGCCHCLTECEFCKPFALDEMCTSNYEDAAFEDCILGTCCAICVVNQLYHTTQQYGNISKDGGKQYNVEEMLLSSANKEGTVDRSFCYKFGEVCLSACCVHWALGLTLRRAIGISPPLSLCISPCMNTSFTRYQYRIKGNDFIHDGICPTFLIFLELLLFPLLPCPCIFGPVIISLSTTLPSLKESRLRRDRELEYDEDKSYHYYLQTHTVGKHII